MPRQTVLSKPTKCCCHENQTVFVLSLKAQKGDIDSYFKKGTTQLPLFRLLKVSSLKSTFHTFFLKSTVAFFTLVLFIAQFSCFKNIFPTTFPLPLSCLGSRALFVQIQANGNVNYMLSSLWSPVIACHIILNLSGKRTNLSEVCGNVTNKNSFVIYK